MKKHIILLSIFVLFTAFAASSVFAAKGTIKVGVGTGGGMGSIAVSDLGIADVGTLPTSRWYFFKEWGRGLERFFTFNAVKKAELEFRIANEKAAEAFKVQETVPDDAGALATALKNYTKAAERLQARLIKLKETSENPNVEKLLEKLNEQTLKHADLLNQLAGRYVGDPDFDLITNAVKDAQEKIQDTVITAAQKEKDIKEKAAEEIKRAEEAIKELESKSAKFAINEPGVPNRMKAGLETASNILANAKTHLARAQLAFVDGKYGEAFGQARAVEVLARNGLRIIITDIKKPTREGRDADTPRVEDINSAMPIVPGTGGTKRKVVPEAEKRVFPETNNRVFPETNNRTACDDSQAPGCLRGEILECHNGKWVCIGPATGVDREGQIPATPTPKPEEKVVTYTDAGYLPSTLTVKNGEIVTFKNQSSNSMWTASAIHPTHRAYPTTGGCLGSTFDACKGVQPGASWSFKFDITGTWKYHDHLSPGDTGTIVVE